MTSNNYLSDSNASRYILCERIMEYYRNRGYRHVKAWVETEQRPNGDKIYVVRSNLKFNVASIYKGK